MIAITVSGGAEMSMLALVRSATNRPSPDQHAVARVAPQRTLPRPRRCRVDTGRPGGRLIRGLVRSPSGRAPPGAYGLRVRCRTRRARTVSLLRPAAGP